MTGWTVPGLVHVRQLRVDPVGMRVVARHRRGRRLVLVTYLSRQFLADPEFRTRFMAESQRLAQVRDVRVARVHQYLECADGAAVVADHVAGTPLRALLLEEGALATEAAFVVLKDVLRGLAAGHAANVAHGDLKPEDVVLTRAGRVRLVDFGLSTRDGRQDLARSTPFYLAPEQWRGGPPTPSGDLYAATATFFECLVGAPPFHADSAVELRALHERSAPPLDAVPALVRQLFRSGLTKDPVGRSSAPHFLAQVEEAAARGSGRGWERRGRRELSRLLAGPSQLPSVPTGLRGRPARERRSPVRLGVVLGGTLALAAGLSSPPSVLPRGPGFFDAGEDPPARALPEIPDTTGTGTAEAPDPGTGRSPGPQSAAMTEPTGPMVAPRSRPGAGVSSAPQVVPAGPEVMFPAELFPGDSAPGDSTPGDSTPGDSTEAPQTPSPTPMAGPPPESPAPESPAPESPAPESPVPESPVPGPPTGQDPPPGPEEPGPGEPGPGEQPRTPSETMARPTPPTEERPGPETSTGDRPAPEEQHNEPPQPRMVPVTSPETRIPAPRTQPSGETTSGDCTAKPAEEGRPEREGAAPPLTPTGR